MALVIVLPDAERDIDDQARYYEDKGTPDTAEHWYRQTVATFRRLAVSPRIGLLWRSRRREYRRARVATVDDFPGQVVVYREVPGGIEVLRVTGGRQDLDRVLGRPR